MKDHYDILGIKYDATADELKISYRKLAVKFHPDKNPGNLFFEERFQEIQQAYDVLSNPEKRKIFDLIRNNHFHEDKENSAANESDRILADIKYTKTTISLIALLILIITFIAILMTI